MDQIKQGTQVAILQDKTTAHHSIHLDDIWMLWNLLKNGAFSPKLLFKVVIFGAHNELQNHLLAAIAPFVDLPSLSQPIKLYISKTKDLVCT